MTSLLKELKEFGADYSILYVEDNPGLRVNIQGLLSKIFTNVVIAENGNEGFEMFKKHKPDIVITDINMPELNGLDMAEKIKSLCSTSKIIVLSAHEETEYFHKAIKGGICRFLPKPTNLNVLMEALYETVLLIQKDEDNILFQVQIQDIFNYQNNIVMMIKNNTPTLINYRFLDFFGVDSLEDFLKQKEALSNLLLEHNDFLYSTEEKSWQDEVFENPGKLFHTKMKNFDGENRHLILKSRKIPNKDNHFVFSFDDITELNLLKLFDKNMAQSDDKAENKASIIKMMKVVQDNSAKVKIHNFYRGLTITNPGVVSRMSDGEVILKTAHAQLKIVHVVKKMLITSEIFPQTVSVSRVKKVDYDNQSISFSDMEFLQNSAVERKNIRLEPEDDHKISLFLDDRKFPTECRILDISIESVKVVVGALPPGVEIGVVVNIALILPTDAQPLVLNTVSKVLRIEEKSYHYELVLMYELQPKALDDLRTYMSKRQMTLIREFKSMEMRG